MNWPEFIGSLTVNSGIPPREVLAMTLPEIAVVCSYQPDTGKKKSGGLEVVLGGEMTARMKQAELRALPPREKIARRLKERNG
ncbi:MAG: hypothetical protein QM703_13660 [Gemmatales bacterium]